MLVVFLSQKAPCNIRQHHYHDVYLRNNCYLKALLGRHGSASLCRVEREKKMAATYMYYNIITL